MSTLTNASAAGISDTATNEVVMVILNSILMCILILLIMFYSKIKIHKRKYNHAKLMLQDLNKETQNSLNEKILNYEHLEVLTKIAQHGHSTVARGIYNDPKGDPYEVAIKTLDFHNLDKPEIPNGPEKFELLFDALLVACSNNLAHKGLEKVKGLCKNDFEIVIVSELLHGDLFTLLHKDPDEGETISWVDSLHIVQDISDVLRYMHKQDPPIPHFRLKSFNILVEDSYRPKPQLSAKQPANSPAIRPVTPNNGDSAKSRLKANIRAKTFRNKNSRVTHMSNSSHNKSYSHNSNSHCSHHDDEKSKNGGLHNRRYIGKLCDVNKQVCTSYMDQTHRFGLWTAPELLKGDEATYKADVYSFAILLWEIYTRKIPFSHAEHASDRHLEYRRAVEHYRPEIPPTMPAVYRTLIEDCWAPDPDSRPDFKEIAERLKDMIPVLSSHIPMSKVIVMRRLDDELGLDQYDLGSLGGKATDDLMLMPFAPRRFRWELHPHSVLYDSNTAGSTPFPNSVGSPQRNSAIGGPGVFGMSSPVASPNKQSMSMGSSRNRAIAASDLMKGIPGTYKDKPVRVWTMSMMVSDRLIQHFEQIAQLHDGSKTVNQKLIQKFVGAFACNGEVGIVSEELPICLGDVFSDKERFASVPWNTLILNLKDAAQGMLALQTLSPPLIIDSLTSFSFCTDASWKIKVCDYMYYNVGKLRIRTTCWTAPELMMDEQLPETKESNMYSFGMVCYHALTRQLPFGRLVPDAVLKLHIAQEHYRPVLPDTLCPTLSAFIKRCWAINPGDRPTMSEARDALKVAFERGPPQIDLEHHPRAREYHIKATIKAFKSIDPMQINKSYGPIMSKPNCYLLLRDKDDDMTTMDEKTFEAKYDLVEDHLPNPSGTPSHSHKATIAENGLKMHYRYRKKGKVRAMRVSSHFGLFKQTPLSVVASPVLMENKAKEAESPKSPSINWKRSLNRVKSEMKDQRVNRPSGAPGDYLVWHLDTGEQLSMSSERFHDIYQLDLNYLHSPATHSPHGHSRTNSIDSQGGRSRVHSEGRSHRRTKSNLKLLSTFNGSADAPSVDSPSVAGAATSFRHGPKRDHALTSLSNLPAIADTSKSLSRSGPELQHVLSKVIEREDSSKNTKTTEKQVDVVISPVPGMLH